MLRSMTGFGRSVMEDSDWTQIWEIRSLNGRYLDAKWRLSSHARGMESHFERVLRRFASRGRIEITLILQQRNGAGENIRFDVGQATAMLNAVQALALERQNFFEPNYNDLFAVEALWESIESDGDDEELEARLEDGLTAALEDWNESRETEGNALAADLAERFLTLKSLVQLIDERAPAIKEERTTQLRERLNEALDALSVAGEIEESRFLQEIVILVDRLDVSEELTRLRTHIDRLNEILANGVDTGRKLDFTLQECFREITTCGNKIQDAQISRVIVDCKNELEKCREQVQNLE